MKASTSQVIQGAVDKIKEYISAGQYMCNSPMQTIVALNDYHAHTYQDLLWKA